MTKPPPRSERHCHYTYITEFRPSQQEVTIIGFFSYCVLPKNLKVCIMHEYFEISLHQIKLTSPYWTAPGVRGIFWEAVLNHVQAAGVQRDGEKMLQAGREGLQRRRSRDLSDRLWGVLQHQVRMEIRWYELFVWKRSNYELVCEKRYVEKLPGQFLADTQCEKLPVEICGAGCVFEEGPEKCHDKVFYHFFSGKNNNEGNIRLLLRWLRFPRRCATWTLRRRAGSQRSWCPSWPQKRNAL